MKFKKDGKVYESTEAMLKANCDTTCMTECEIRTRCRKWESCVDYAYVYPAEVAQYLGFEVIEENSPTIAEIVEKHGEDVKPKRRTLGASNPTEDMTEYVEKYLEAVKPDPVNHPAHYTSGGIECIDAMQAAFGAEVVKDFCLCNAFKYLWRHRNKNGVEDLKKARWYLNRLIREMEVTDDE